MVKIFFYFFIIHKTNRLRIELRSKILEIFMLPLHQRLIWSLWVTLPVPFLARESAGLPALNPLLSIVANFRIELNLILCRSIAKTTLLIGHKYRVGVMLPSIQVESLTTTLAVSHDSLSHFYIIHPF